MKKKIMLLLLMVTATVSVSCNRNVNREITAFEEIDAKRENVESPQKKKVALTFDDGPSGIYTESLLDELKKRDVKATFFIMGENIQENEKIIIRMAKEGHVIGNHTYTHVDLTKLKFDEACEEINRTNAYIYNISGYIPRYIRPPYGSCDDNILKETNMSIVLWNVDPMDWKDQNANVVYSRIIKNVKDGDIILLHDIFKSSVEAAIRVVDELKKRNFEFVTINEIGDNKKIIQNNGEE